MIALSFTAVGPEKWIGKQPDGTVVGYVARSRKHDERYAFEAKLRKPYAGERRHCGYGDTPEAAQWMLVLGLQHRLACFVTPP